MPFGLGWVLAKPFPGQLLEKAGPKGFERDLSEAARTISRHQTGVKVQGVWFDWDPDLSPKHRVQAKEP